MLIFMFARGFNQESLGTACTVNYLWLCARGPLNTFPDYATRLPLHYFERAYANAKQYPEAEFNFWFDSNQLTFRDGFFLDSHRHAFEANNIQIRDLQSIAEYREMPGFAADTNIALYARADCARILVLNHLLQTQPDNRAVYSDLDCEDVAIRNADIAEIIDEHGFVCGRSGGHHICNGYIAVQGDKGRSFMTEYLLPRTVTSFQKNLVNHFGAFMDAVRTYRNAHCPELKYAELGRVELPLMRTVMHYDSAIYGRVCPQTPPRVPASREYV